MWFTWFIGIIDSILEEDSHPGRNSPLPSLKGNTQYSSNNISRRGSVGSVNSIGSNISNRSGLHTISTHSINTNGSPLSYGNIKPLSYGREKQHQIQLKQERKTLISNYKYSQFTSQPIQKPLNIEW